MGMTIGIIAQGPTKKIVKNDIKTAREYGKDIAEIIDTQVIGISVKEALGKSALLTKKRIIKLAAVFFDRVCSRTPMDEDYKGVIKRVVTDKDTGEESIKEITIEHHADKNFCRLDWEIQIGPRKVTSFELWRINNGLFETYNNSKDIDFIADYFESNFKNVELKYFDTLQVQNMNDHFSVLEFGQYKKNETQVMKGHRYEHGVKNRHSVQAPQGMLRLALVELDRIAHNDRVKSLSRRYRNQRTFKMLDELKLKYLANSVKKGNGYFTLADIEQILGSDVKEL